MKSSVFKYVLIVSLLMNCSLLGAAAYTHYAQSRYHRANAPFLATGGMPGHPAGPGPRMFFEELSLKPDQVKLFQKKAEVFHSTLAEKRQEVDRSRASLLALMRANNPDKGAIEATIARISSVQEDMQRMVVSHMLEFKSMLATEQQKKFLDMIDGAMTQRRDAACP